MNNGNNTKIVESKPKPKWIPKESNLSKKIDEDNTSKNSSESATTNFIIRWNEELWANSFGQPIPEEILSQCLPGYCKLCGVFLKSNDASAGRKHYLGEIHKEKVEIALGIKKNPNKEYISHYSNSYSEDKQFSGPLCGKLNSSLEKIDKNNENQKHWATNGSTPNVGSYGPPPFRGGPNGHNYGPPRGHPHGPPHRPPHGPPHIPPHGPPHGPPH